MTAVLELERAADVDRYRVKREEEPCVMNAPPATDPMVVRDPSADGADASGSGGRSAGGSAESLTIRVETPIDFDETAALASAGFGVSPGSFNPVRLRWLYETAFSNGSTVLGVFAQGRKVGQVALVHQSVCIDGRLQSAIALMDLFILKEFRSREVMARLYAEVERLCRETPIRLILAVPNGNGARVNVRYLGLADFMKLDIRAGVVGPWRHRSVAMSVALDQIDHATALTVFSRFLPSEADGLFWTPQTLLERFGDAGQSYGVHACETLLLISSTRTARGLPYTLLCAFFPKPNAVVQRKDVISLTHAACSLHRRSLFVYAGINRDVPLPGLSLPERLRPSAMMLQIRDFQAIGSPSAFRRFELLDFDFA